VGSRQPGSYPETGFAEIWAGSAFDSTALPRTGLRDNFTAHIREPGSFAVRAMSPVKMDRGK
jgi:hypothetical protein